MTEQTKTKRLSLKQEKFVEAYIDNGGNATQAALVAYDTNKVDAGNIGRQNLDKQYIKDIIDSKVKALKDSTLDCIKENDLVRLALATAQDDLMSRNPKTRCEARKYILEVAKFLSESERTPHDNGPKTLVIPGWKGKDTNKSK